MLLSDWSEAWGGWLVRFSNRNSLLLISCCHAGLHVTPGIAACQASLPTTTAEESSAFGHLSCLQVICLSFHHPLSWLPHFLSSYANTWNLLSAYFNFKVPQMLIKKHFFGWHFASSMFLPFIVSPKYTRKFLRWKIRDPSYSTIYIN